MDEELINAEYELQTSQGLPQGVKVATYSQRSELQEALQKLEHNGFPMQTLFIINKGLRQVDFLMGKMSYPRVALSAALSGLLFGLVFSAFTGLATGTSMLSAAVSYVPLAIAFTVIYAVLNFSRRRKSSGLGYLMRSVTIPESIELHTLPMTAQQAQQILGVQPRQRQAPQRPEFFLPSQYQRPQNTATNQQSVLAQPAAQPQQQSYQLPPVQDDATVVLPAQTGSVPTSEAPTVPMTPYIPARKDATPAAQHFGKLIEDPEEYAANIRQEPEPLTTNERVEQIRAEQRTGRYGLRAESQEEFENMIRKPEDETRQD